MTRYDKYISYGLIFRDVTKNKANPGLSQTRTVSRDNPEIIWFPLVPISRTTNHILYLSLTKHLTNTKRYYTLIIKAKLSHYPCYVLWQGQQQDDKY